jgi:hypothetical protein
MSNTQHKRAPKGYSIKQWADGDYHVYDSAGGCILETPSKREALAEAWRDRDAHKPQEPAEAAEIATETD